MKITDEDYQIIKTAIKKLGVEFLREHWKMYQIAGSTAKIFRWNCLYASGAKINKSNGTKGDLIQYSYLNAKRVDEALERVMDELKIM